MTGTAARVENKHQWLRRIFIASNLTPDRRLKLTAAGSGDRIIQDPLVYFEPTCSVLVVLVGATEDKHKGDLVMSKTLVLAAVALAFSAASASAQAVYPGYGYAPGYR
jgi:hypothetical protein